MKHKMRRHFSLEDRREEQTKKIRLLWEERVREKEREDKIDWTLRGRKEKIEVCMCAQVCVCVCDICVISIS